jgi:hypothetical protein
MFRQLGKSWEGHVSNLYEDNDWPYKKDLFTKIKNYLVCLYRSTQMDWSLTEEEADKAIGNFFKSHTEKYLNKHHG